MSKLGFSIGTFSGSPQDAQDYGVPDELQGCYCRRDGKVNFQFSVLHSWLVLLRDSLISHGAPFRVTIAHVTSGERSGLHVAYILGPNYMTGLTPSQLALLQERCRELNITQYTSVDRSVPQCILVKTN